MDFDASWDEKAIYPEIESGFVFRPHMNEIYVEAFNVQTFNQNGTENEILITKYYNPLNLIFQHLPGKEKVKSIEVNRTSNGYILMFLTNVDIQEIVKKRW